MILTDIRQLRSRDNLTNLVGAADEPLDKIMRTVNAEVQGTYRSIVTDLYEVTVKTALPINPETSFVRAPGITKQSATAGSTNNQISDYTTGTVTFPSSPSGNITCNPGTTVAISGLTVGNYTPILITVNMSNGNLVATQGSVVSSLANLPIPEAPNGHEIACVVILENNGGTVVVLNQSRVISFNSTKIMPFGGIVGTADEQTLTNKTLSAPVLSGVVTISAATFTGNFLPTTNATYTIGSDSYRFSETYSALIRTNNIESFSTGATAGVLNLGVTSDTQTVNIGTGSSIHTVNIGTGSGKTYINIGASGDVITFAGATNISAATNTAVTDKKVMLNVGGLNGSSSGSGLFIQEAAITLLTATSALWQSGNTIRIAMANTGNIAINEASSQVTILGFSNSLNNGTFTVSAVSSNTYIEIQNPNRSDATGDETGASATVGNPNTPAGIYLKSSDTWGVFVPANAGLMRFTLDSAAETGFIVRKKVNYELEIDLLGNAIPGTQAIVPANNGYTSLGSLTARFDELHGFSILKVSSILTASQNINEDYEYVQCNSTSGTITLDMDASYRSATFTVGRKWYFADVGGQAASNAIGIRLPSGHTYTSGGQIAYVDSPFMVLGIVYLGSNRWGFV